MIEKKKINWLSLFVICIGLTGVYGIPYLTRGFYDVFKDAMNLSHTQIGMLMSVFGTLNIFAYLVGGWMADFFSAKKMMIIGCLGNSVLGLTILLFPTYGVLLVVFALFAFTANVAFFPAMIKAIRTLGDSSDQGKLFGFKETFYGLFGVIVGLLVIVLGNLSGGDDYTKYKLLLVFYSVMTLIPGILLMFVYKDVETEKSEKKPNSKVMILTALKMKRTWLVAISILTCYTVYAGLTYTSPYLTDVLGMSNDMSSVLGIVRQYLASMFMCAIFGIIADRVGSSVKICNYTFIGFLVLGILLLIIPAKASMLIPLFSVIILLTIIGCGVRGIYYAQIDEAKFPLEITGTALGIISFIAFFPDVFYYSVMGNIIDNAIASGNPAAGYKVVFLVSVIITVVGIVAGFFLYKSIKNDDAKKLAENK